MSTRQEPPVRAAVYPNVRAAERAVHELIEAGFPREAISVVAPESMHGDFDGVESEEPAGAHTKEAALAGGTVGALLGGLTLAVGLAATGGTGLVFVGPLVLAAAGGGAAGGFIGAMATRGFEPEVADYYDQALRKGQVLVSAETLDGMEVPPLETAERVFESTGAVPIELPRD